MFPVDAFRDTLAKFTDILERHAIRFHLTGGLTGAAYGEPRIPLRLKSESWLVEGQLKTEQRSVRGALTDFGNS